MIDVVIFKEGNLLKDGAEALVNTVNCVGVMGKGIALQFKQAYPKMFTSYEKASRKNEIVPGKMHVVETQSLLNPKYIINFPTKRHWRNDSRMEDIDAGLIDLVKLVEELNIQSIAIPPLGCGNGGLAWSDVYPRIVAAFKELPNVKVHLYTPSGSPTPNEMIIRTSRPKMTKARALLLMLMNDYSIPGYRLTLLEVQKLAYFLQEVGEPLRLRFEKGKFGPYADNLNHVLQRLDGHFIHGFGDRQRNAAISLAKDAKENAHDFLMNEGKTFQHLEKVREIIQGFETPYGLELLSTVHWIIVTKRELEEDIEGIVAEVHQWNERKRRIFKERHIVKAWEHLLNMSV